MKTANPFNVQTGDIWEEVLSDIDSRFYTPRRIKVLDVAKEYATIITIGVEYKTRPQKAKLYRFDGKSHNYRLVRHAKKSKGAK